MIYKDSPRVNSDNATPAPTLTTEQAADIIVAAVGDAVLERLRAIRQTREQRPGAAA
jgi:hypothetical protein